MVVNASNTDCAKQNLGPLGIGGRNLFAIAIEEYLFVCPDLIRKSSGLCFDTLAQWYDDPWCSAGAAAVGVVGK